LHQSLHASVKERLERARQLVSQNTGRPVSISDVAKLYLESTIRDDILLDVIQLLDKPTESMLAIRRKWEGGLPLSRAEWNMMGYYVCQGAERLPENPCLPYPETIAELLEAFLAVRALRAQPRPDLDHHYLTKLLNADVYLTVTETGHPLNQTVAALLDQLRNAHPKIPSLSAGHAFAAILREEPFSSVELSNALAPYWPALYRLAARGHWLREHKPLHDAASHFRARPVLSVSPLVAWNYELTVALPPSMDLAVTLYMKPQRVVYPIASYPEVCDFATITRQFRGEQTWTGNYFFAYASKDPGDLRIALCNLRNGLTVQLSTREWDCVRQLFASLFEKPELGPVFEALALAYGEL
jgi:hypothetical protein